MILNVKNVSAGYENKKIIEDVSFSVEKGDYVCVAGENGSGKSTLIKTIAKIVKCREGQIEYYTKRIGYLPQQTEDKKNFPASVYEVVLSGCLNSKKYPFYTKKLKQKARENIKLFKLDKLMNKQFCNLSGGQKQRVLLARAFCASEEFLILDEPVTGLDPVATEELYKIIYDLNTEKKVTVIMISHDMRTAVKYANKILHMTDGKMKFYGNTDEYLKTDIGIHFTGRCCPHYE